MPAARIVRAALLAALLPAAVPAAAIAVGGCPPPTTDATTRPEIRRGHEVRFRDRLTDISNALRTGRFDVIILGDSLVQQWPLREAERAFPGAAILNAGVAGDGAAALLHRLASRRTDAVVDGARVAIGVSGWENQRPRTVVLLIGTNDLRRGTPCDVATGIATAADAARRIWPAADLLVLGVLPRGPAGGELAPEIAEVNARLTAGAAGPGAPYRFLDLGGALACGAGPCTLRRPPNHVHLTPEGYARLAAGVRDAARAAPR